MKRWHLQLRGIPEAEARQKAKGKAFPKHILQAKRVAQGRGRGRGGGAKTGVKKEPDGQLRCLMCPEPRYRKLRWCQLHRNSYGAMRIDADAEGRLEVFEKQMMTDHNAIDMMQDWEKVLPPARSTGRGVASMIGRRSKSGSARGGL